MNENNSQKTDTEIAAEIKSLQGKVLLGKILLIAGFIGIFAAIFLGRLVYIIPLLAAAFAGAIITKKFTKALKESVGSGILEAVLGNVFDDVAYLPFEHISGSAIDSADFGFHYDEIEGNDYVSATYKGLNIEMSDIGLVEISYSTDSDGHTTESRSYVFRGLWLICDFGKEISADVRV